MRLELKTSDFNAFGDSFPESVTLRDPQDEYLFVEKLQFFDKLTPFRAEGVFAFLE